MNRAPTRVLVVDDEPPIRELLTRWLAKWGYRTESAATAATAIDIMSVAPADILLCDVRMPGHDGLWLAECVRARWPDTAIIMATALDDVQTVLQSHRLGAVDYVRKPFAPAVLRQAVDGASGRAQYRPSVEQAHTLR
jgi:DNA-binding response OmpR family regulator